MIPVAADIDSRADRMREATIRPKMRFRPEG